MPRFTIGIPTYNRASSLRRSIQAAIDQTHPDVEVLVSDDASTDETPEVVRSFGDRVRYHRNPQNIGSWPNFVMAAELASGEFFSWLQDDDLVHRDFARRASRAMSEGDDIAVYAAYEVEGPSATIFHRPVLYGPAVPLDWMRGELRVIDGSVVAPMSFFVSFVNPPAVAFRTSVIRKAVRFFDPECELFNERIVVARATDRARVAVDPWPAAIFLSHEQQASKKALPDEAIYRQWLRLSQHIGEILEGSGAGAWKPQLRRCFEEMAIRDRLDWARHVAPGFPLPEEIWERAHPLAREARSILLESLPAPIHHEAPAVADQQTPAEAPSGPSWARRVARQLVPPLAWDAFRSIRRRLQHPLHELGAP